MERMKFEDSIGYGKVDGEMRSEIHAVTVVLVRDPEMTLGYRMISAYPDGTVK